MRKFLILPAALLAVGCTYYDAGQDVAEMATDAEQAALAETIRGRTAGEPVRCITQREIENTRSLGPGTIIFEERGDGTVFVNRTRSHCAAVTYQRTLLTESGVSDRLCELDRVTVVDRSGMSHGTCTLGAFTPYRRGS